MTDRAPRELVELVDEEVIGDRGPVIVRWLVRHNDGWIPASRYDGARSERLDSGPRVVWRSRILVALSRDTLVTRVETRPAPARGSTLEHLTGTPRRSRERSVRAAYRVGPGGVLSPESRAVGRTK